MARDDTAIPVPRPASEAVRDTLVEFLRRDLVGPHPDRDPDLARERLSADERPSQWYLTGFIAPIEDGAAMGAAEAAEEDADLLEEREAEVDDVDAAEATGAGEGESEAPSTKRRFFPSSIGITVMLPPGVETLEARVTWGDYLPDPPVPEAILAGEEEEDRTTRSERRVEWQREPRERVVSLRVPAEGVRGRAIVPDSAGPCPGGGLELEIHARLFRYETPDNGTLAARVATVFLVNRRRAGARTYADATYAFQARLALACEAGFLPRHDIAGYEADDVDLRIADLHYRDVCDYAVGRNVAADWDRAIPAGAPVTCVWTDPLPRAPVHRVAPNEDAASKEAVTFGMEDLAACASAGPEALRAALAALPDLYGAFIAREAAAAGALAAPRRRETAERLVADMRRAQARIAEGIALLADPHDDLARIAFRLMNEAVARAARRRNAGPGGKPEAQAQPTWRPFQLAFVLLNLAGLVDKRHPDREIADLLFFPTGGGKTEAYLGLAAFAIALRRLRGPGLLGAGVSVIMRYTLRLLTLDQLARAAGVVCALELMREAPENRDAKGRRLLGDWPIEIGLWVGSDASPNRLGGKGDTDDATAVARVKKYQAKKGPAPAPLKACPWCGTPFVPDGFKCEPNAHAPTRLDIRCDNLDCDFTADRALPIRVVDEDIYRRLPAFLIATVDKFASLPWVGETGAFFRGVDRHMPGLGFFGAAEPGQGTPLGNGWSLDPPDLVVQDELHLISGPLGTVAGLYEAAIDLLASRRHGDRTIRPKIVASTATVRRAEKQIASLFDRNETAVFPPPGIDLADSFFARTAPHDPARLYVGIAAQGRGPKLVFLRTLTTLLAGAQARYEAAGGKPADGSRNPADPYLTALCYFNALRELGGARRIVEDEVRERVGGYGTKRRRLSPPDDPFRDRTLSDPLELTSRVSTDDVAVAKARLEATFGREDAVDVALATNMISVGLDITRLGLMLVQGQPKTAAEYIQATSRVGRDPNRPGLVVAILNLHKPRDRMHYEQFGQFHRTFYRAVEATSVTPWAARALDRALAAVVVACARHIEPTLTPEDAASRIRDDAATRAAVREAILARAPDEAIVGGKAALGQALDTLFSAWEETARLQTQSGGGFAYARKQSPQRLLHAPLDRALSALPSEHRLFQAGRSMRDVEPAVPLRLRDPHGQEIA